MSNTIDSQITNPQEDACQFLSDLIKRLEIPILEICPHQVIIENSWTDFIQIIIDYANENVLRSFQLHLEMEY
ncbi:MAG: hypothetical protein ACRD8W_23035 [Nitrososphaeraceae archaeon]